MDVDEALLRARVALVHLRTLQDQAAAKRDGNEDKQLELLHEIADSFEAIDEWLSKQGYTPSAWERRPDATRRD